MNTEGKKGKFLELFLKKNLNISKTCESIGISRGTYYLWLSNDEEFKKEVEYINEKDIDDSEESSRLLRLGKPKLDENGKLIEWDIKPDITALIFHLKTKGKYRGYVEKTETDVNLKSQKIEFEVVKKNKV